jgi:hypothetical protein
MSFKLCVSCFSVGYPILKSPVLNVSVALHAQATPPVYVVSLIDITQPEPYPAEYALKMQALIKSHGGKQVAIGGSAELTQRN